MMSNNQKLKQIMLPGIPMSVSQSVDMKSNSVSSQKDDKQSDLVDTPYFEKIDSLCDTDLFKNQLERQNSIPVQPSDLNYEFSLQPKCENSSTSDKNQTSLLESKENLLETYAFKTDTNKLTLSDLKPEIFHPTVQRPNIRKNQEPVKEYSVQFQEIKRILNQLKRPHEDSERQFLVSEKKDILIGAIEECDYVINDFLKSISKNHAIIRYEESNDQWLLIDQNSINGTYIIQEEIVLKVDMKVLIGTFICEVKSIFSLDKGINRVCLFFTNLVDESIHPFLLEFDVKQEGAAYQIGQKFQKQLLEDDLIVDIHCTIKMNSKNQIILMNQPNVYDQVGVKIQQNTPFKLNKENIIKFGFLNKYKIVINKNNSVETTFSKKSQVPDQSIKQVSNNACLICEQSKLKIYHLKPCNHKGLCIECIMTKSKNVCPSCKQPFHDFDFHIHE